MAIKKEVIVLSVVFDTHDTYGESALTAIEHELYNTDGVIEWDARIKREDTLQADLTDEDLEGDE